MDVFDLRQRLVEDYGRYTRSFINIADERIKAKVDGDLDGGALWPEPLLQLNPTFKPGGTVDDLVRDETLHAECSRIFRIGKSPENPSGGELLLHTHQSEAIRKAKVGRSYVLTSGTGSGKSLTYIVPIVDHVLRNGAGRGVQAIVVYPMNALANSQDEELRKFLSANGETPPVRWARYTGQERGQQREALRANPPDVLLTNYMMLELLLTRREDRALVAAAQGLKFLVFDELHTYRGRQGADVALLIRRCRLAFGGHDFVCVGTSATMATEGTTDDQKRVVAKVAETLFGTKVGPDQVIGETLERSTPEYNWADAAVRRRLVESVERGDAPPETYEEFRAHPLAGWIESTFGVRAELGTGRLIRQKPQRLRGKGSAAAELAAWAEKDEGAVHSQLRAFFTKGASLRRDASARFPIFAFRLHQFLTRGDTVWATLESEDTRYLALEKSASKPEEPEKPLFPLVFCRVCGTAYYRVSLTNEDGTRRLAPREDTRDASVQSSTDAYVYLSQTNPWPAGTGPEVLSRVPDFMKEVQANGTERIAPAQRAHVPEVVFLAPDGTITSEGRGIATALLKDSFRFCLHPDCRVAYAGTQRSERSKLATLGVDNRSTATTVLAVRALIELQADATLKKQSRKLLSFTDNRQDASLQAGHFNDFSQVALLRSALFKAVAGRGESGLKHEHLAGAIFDALSLSFEEYAADPEIRGPARSSTNDALKRVIQYHLYRDLRRLWRVAAPNLEDCGLLRFDYLGIKGGDGLLADTEIWNDSVSVREGREAAVVHVVPQPLKDAPSEMREDLIVTLLDYLRRNLVVKVDVLDRTKQEELLTATQSRLAEGTVWYLNEAKELEHSDVAYPRSRHGQEYGLFVSSYGGFGRFVRRSLKPHVPAGVQFGRDEVDGVIRYLFLALRKYGVLEQVRSGDPAGYQINPDALLWLAGDGEERATDRTRLIEVGETPPQANPYFVECYRRFADLKARLEAREHTAQVTAEDREEREDRFRSADLPLLFCSPTMELGVDISQLNVVNLRNVPPTPANYAQRSGRAGRGGQPALVYTYCAGRSPHDQYYFRQPEDMVGGAVAAPRIDLRNADLVRSHVHAVWMEVARPDMGKTLTSVLDLAEQDGHIPLPVKQEVKADLVSLAHRTEAQRRTDLLIQSIAPHLVGASWFHDQWTKDVFNQLERSFDTACTRWRLLYRAARRQRELHHRIIGDQTRPQSERDQSKRLRAQAETQIRLLTQAEGIYEGDFYSYRYFAAEGFLPGYNFPRLPISAFVPARRGNKGRDEFVSRPRFLAISEFGPRALVYHEGARYRVQKVDLDFGSDDIEQTHSLLTNIVKRCASCGYAHIQAGMTLPEVCERCASALGNDTIINDMVQLQNVTLKLAQRITCDEEERQRFGYDLVSSYKFGQVADGGTGNARVDRKDADVFIGDTRVMKLSYGDAASLFRINLGWRQRGPGQPNGFLLDLEKGYWASNPKDDSDSPETTVRTARVVPYVNDTKNALVMAFDPARSVAETASLQAAFKEAIQQVYQLEPRELSCEPMPSPSKRTEILFYEASEGGAGVLRQLVEDRQAIARLATRALAACHYDTEGRDEAPGQCGKACYRCLLDYGNQPDHQILDRRLIRDFLIDLLESDTRPAGGTGTREDRLAALRAKCDSGLEKKWLDRLDSLGLMPPSDGQFLITSCSTRPDFFYADHNVAIYVDGPPHDTPGQVREDEEITARLQQAGYAVIRFHHRADWGEIFKRHPDVFGVARA